MKYLFLLTLLVLIGVTVYADYLWKQWLRSRKNNSPDGSSDHDGFGPDR